MVTYILLAMCAICTPIVMSMQKLYNKTSPQGVIGLWFYVTLASFFAILFFSISAKFCLPVNKITLIYSAAFAIICIASICFSLLALKRVNLVLVSIFTNAGALLIPVVAGKFIFDENLSSYDIIASAIMLISIILPLLQIQKKKQSYRICFLHNAFYLRRACNNYK